jgi:hypothetical protein
MTSVAHLAAIAIALTAAASSPAGAQNVPGWVHEAAAGVQFAYFTGKDAELAVRCKGPQVEVVFYIDTRVADAALRDRTSGVLTMVVDGTDDLQWIQSRLVAETGVITIGVGGGAANDMAHTIANATKSVMVSVMTEPPKPDAVQYNRSQFPVFGAGDAIKAAYAACGMPF